jgi:hypothetical protein
MTSFAFPQKVPQPESFDNGDHAANIYLKFRGFVSFH